MVDGTYAISMRTPLGLHEGSVVLSSLGDALSANISINGVGSMRQNGSCSGDEFQLSGSIKLFLLGRVNFDISGLVAGDTLKATCATNKGTFDIMGSRIES